MEESSTENILYSGEDFEHIDNSFNDLFEGVTKGGRKRKVEEEEEEGDQDEEPITNQPPKRNRKLEYDVAPTKASNMSMKPPPSPISPPTATSGPSSPLASLVGCKCHELKKDVEEMKNDIEEIKKDVEEMKIDIRDIKEKSKNNYILFQKITAIVTAKLDKKTYQEKENEVEAILQDIAVEEEDKLESMENENEKDKDDDKIGYEVDEINSNIGAILNDIVVEEEDKLEPMKNENENVKDDDKRKNKLKNENVKDVKSEEEPMVNSEEVSMVKTEEELMVKSLKKKEVKVKKVVKKKQVKKEKAMKKVVKNKEEKKEEKVKKVVNNKEEDDLKEFNTPHKIQFVRRTRKSKNDVLYTNPDLKLPKLNDPLTFNPLLKYDDQLLTQLQNMSERSNYQQREN
ncbi:ABC transporter F family member 4-like [Impatiens glandulifera]|uniref:ABC transporter F family member 4-like n=1 Tax=Impatiens glandulifera TaxID=253017 RepID=UPI001FB13164|nr:ABC transporter F family member 4-like [Impatiens glandulifera]